MKSFITVFKFEFQKLVSGKSFIVLTAILVIVLAGVLSFPRLSNLLGDDVKDIITGDDGVPEIIGIVNNSDFNDENLYDSFSKVLNGFEYKAIDKSLEASKTLVKDEEYKHIIILDAIDDYTIISSQIGINDSIVYQLENVIRYEYKLFKLAENNVDEQTGREILNAKLKRNIVETGKSQTNTFFYTYILVFLLYMSIIVYGQLVATSVASEKSTRAMEILITTVHPVKMMFGKVFGSGCAALSQLAVIIGSGVIFYNINAKFWQANDIIRSVFDIPVQTIIISACLFVLGFFVYAFIYAAIGSLVSRVEDLSSSILPITFVSIISFMVVMFSMISGKVDSALMKFCSFFPLTSPYALLVRFSMSDMSVWQTVISMVILLITVIFSGYISAAIYKIGVLLYGQPPKLRELARLRKK